MALANFFNRANQALGQVLLTADPTTLSDKLDKNPVAIVFDDRALELPNTPVMLNMAVNLFSRLYPRVALVCHGKKGNDLKEDLIRLAKSINPDIDFVEADSFSAALCIGESHVTANTKVFVTADSWNVEVSIDHPVNILKGHVFNPLSATAAACLGASEIFRIVFGDLLQSKHEDYVLSILDFKRRPSPIQEFPLIKVEDVLLVGLGAIGNAAVWCLSRIPELIGTVYLIDDERVDLSNLQRYVLADQNTVGMLKTDLAMRFLSRDKLQITDHSLKFGEFIAKHRPDCKVNVIAISVDNAEDRIAAQAVLPRFIINAWTNHSGLLGTSHHWFDNEQACLACLYLSKNKRKSFTDRVAEVIGFENRRTAELIVNKAPLTKELLEEIALLKGYSLDVLKRWEGLTLNDFYSEGICGGVLLQLGSYRNDEALVPLAHQSVLAGVLLATEIVKYALGYVSRETPVETRFNVLSTPTEYITFPHNKSSQPKCICTDEDYITAYQEKYGTK